MLFLKDILIFDFETNGVDPKTCDPLQLGAVLVDKDTLAIKAEYTSFIKPEHTSWDKHSAAIHGLEREILMKTGQDTTCVFKEFQQAFDIRDIIFASWNAFDINILSRFIDLEALNIYKFIELWSYTYPYVLSNNVKTKKGYLHGLTLFIEHFNLTERNTHDALEDAKIEAYVFRKVTEFYKSVKYNNAPKIL